jgi:hypothetical protein
VLVGAGGAGALGDLALDVLVELVEVHDAVAVRVGGAPEALEEVGEEAVAQLGELDGDLRRAGGGDEDAAPRAGDTLDDPARKT